MSVNWGSVPVFDCSDELIHPSVRLTGKATNGRDRALREARVMARFGIPLTGEDLLLRRDF